MPSKSVRLIVLMVFSMMTAGAVFDGERSECISAEGPVLPLAIPTGQRDLYEWTEVLEEDISFHLNSTSDLQLYYEPGTDRLERVGQLDPYLSHNSTVRSAIDRAPQWLNLTLSFRFHDLSPYYVNRYIDLLTNCSIDIRYLDELAFMISFLPVYFLNSYWVLERLLLENVRMMYVVSDEVLYADIVDVQRADGQHSTLVYATPGGNVTLPEEVYYWYLVMPRSELETPSYIDLSNYRKTIDEDGAFWRSFLYTANDTGFPVLRDLLSNITTIWNGTKNRMEDNGAVGAVTFWANRCIQFFYQEGMRRDHQPVSLYKQHFGLCGENAEVLVAAAKTALIPAVVSITFEGMHAWNEFYERGWHQWQAYSGHIDDPSAEGAPGSVSVFTNFNPDMSQFSGTPLYTTTATLKVRVKDAQGLPVDGAMVRITSQSMVNDPMIIPLIGNLTDVRGETSFIVGSGRQYFLQVLSPIGLWGNSTDPLVLAFPTTPPGATLEFNVTMTQRMPLRVGPVGSVHVPSSLSFKVTLTDIVQMTEAWTDPMNYGIDHWRSYPDRTSLTIYFLDEGNSTLYRSGLEFMPTAELSLSANATGTVELGGGANWTIVVPGLSLPMTRTRASIKVEVLVPLPKVSIVSPVAGTYLTTDVLEFQGAMGPPGPYLEGMQYAWMSNKTADALSNSLSFSRSLDEGHHNITLIAWNGTGLISRDHVELRMVRPNHSPSAVISSPLNGSVFEQGELVLLSSEGSFDIDGDRLTYIWTEGPWDGEVLSHIPSFSSTFRVGRHNVTLTVTDPFLLSSSDTVSFEVVPLNNPPVPYISSPLHRSIHRLGVPVPLSANGTFDMDGDLLSYDWTSSRDGHLSSAREDTVVLTLGQHTIVLNVTDGTNWRQAVVEIEVEDVGPPVNLPPVAVIGSPGNGDRFYMSDTIFFSSEGSHDPDGDIIALLWTINGNPASESASFGKVLGEGVHAVSLSVTDGASWDIASISIMVVNRPPVLSVKVNGSQVRTGDEIIAFEDDTMVFDASTSYDPDNGSLVLNWSIGGTEVRGDQVWSASFPADLYFMELTATDEGNRSASVSFLLRTLKRSSDEGPSNTTDEEEEGLSPLIIAALVIVTVCPIIVFVLVILSRRIKVGGPAWED